jgi:hypothetical protein
MFGDATLPSVGGLDLQAIDEVDYVVEHPRSFGRGETIYDPWHSVPLLARKPGALRNGAPFKDGVLPTAIERVRRKLAGADDGNRQMVDILQAELHYFRGDGLVLAQTSRS